MKCQDVQELFGQYWDLPDNDIKRLHVDAHIKRCKSCAEEFEIWKVSTEWIQAARPSAPPAPSAAIPTGGAVSQSVMDRIYHDESWRVPIATRTYMISYKLRRNLTALIALFLAIFVYTVVYSFIMSQHSAEQANDFSGIMPAASVSSTASLDLNQTGMFEGIPVASISSPKILSMDSFPHYPNYWLALSLFGMFCALLIMNWLSRIRN